AGATAREPGPRPEGPRVHDTGRTLGEAGGGWGYVLRRHPRRVADDPGRRLDPHPGPRWAHTGRDRLDPGSLPRDHLRRLPRRPRLRHARRPPPDAAPCPNGVT